MLASARKFGYRSYEYEARLVLAEIELQSHSAAARPHLAALGKGREGTRPSPDCESRASGSSGELARALAARKLSQYEGAGASPQQVLP